METGKKLSSRREGGWVSMRPPPEGDGDTVDTTEDAECAPVSMRPPPEGDGDPERPGGDKEG